MSSEPNPHRYAYNQASDAKEKSRSRCLGTKRRKEQQGKLGPIGADSTSEEGGGGAMVKG